MKSQLLLISFLLVWCELALAESYVNYPLPLDGQWNSGNELIIQNGTKLIVYIDHKKRGPFNGSYYKYHHGEHLIFVDFTDAPGCCTGRVDMNGRVIQWSNNSQWTKDKFKPDPVVPPPGSPRTPPSKKTYHDDRIQLNGYRLDWCLHRGTQCGKPAADSWCAAIKGIYQWRSVQFTQAPDIGRIAPTYILGDKTLCQAPSCDGFASITCEPTPGVIIHNN